MAGFEKFVVLKRILPHLANDEEFVSMFLDEAKTTVALSHGNIVQVFDMGRGEEGDYFIAMEYVAGKNLRRFFKRSMERESKPIDPSLAAWIAGEILKGLDYAHRRTDSSGRPLGIVHRDLSPHNILISYEGEVKVADFGIAKAAGKVVHTETGLIRGKAAYMSPEQAKAEDLDGRSDLFSVGTLLYELLTGGPPFEGENADAILRSLLRGPPPPPSTKCTGLSPALDAIVLKALGSTREERYASADLLAKDLGVFLANEGRVIGPRDLAARMQSLFAEDLAQERRQMAALPKAAAPPTVIPGSGTVAVATAVPAPAQEAGINGSIPMPSLTKDLGAGGGTSKAWSRTQKWAYSLFAAGVIAAAFGGIRSFQRTVATPTPTAIVAIATATIAIASPVASATPIAVATAPPIPSVNPKTSPTPRASLVAALPSPIASRMAPAMGRLSVPEGSQGNFGFVYVDKIPVHVKGSPYNVALAGHGEITMTPLTDYPVLAGSHIVCVEQWNDDQTKVVKRFLRLVQVPPGDDAFVVKAELIPSEAGCAP